MAKTRRKGHEIYVKQFKFETPLSGLGDSFSTSCFNSSTADRRVWRKRDNAEARRQANREIAQQLTEGGF